MSRQMAAIFATGEPHQPALPRPCEVCGEVGSYGRPVDGGQVFPFPVWLRVPTSTGATTATLVRCNDRQGCRDRFEFANPEEVWPFEHDRTTRSTVLLTTPSGTAYAASLPSVTPEPRSVESRSQSEHDSPPEYSTDHASSMPPADDEWSGF